MEKAEIVLNSLPMSGGDGPNSYSKNSHLQRKTTSLLKETIDKLIVEKLDAKTLISGSNTFRIADLGCATGPNTFFFVDDIIRSVETNLRQSNFSKPEFLVYFNDLPENDFNTLFTSLPQDRKKNNKFVERDNRQTDSRETRCKNPNLWLQHVPNSRSWLCNWTKHILFR
ncbi:PREDICTED: probable S-adenosylmethionine-dependent methyltransferase At5g37990 [Camelina sativa]|uniref:Probable S-adenosylmethionine-dependent methyltransferase At5g37990 n=1 Tax=Camelina sativa TaxID=90675 RepID=A0ABM1RPL2_CAMSA|nr:PREDICTED: probable S-adenosylmethionine-dependent methyltransferase At5g37990 [Camelina sativa]